MSSKIKIKVGQIEVEYEGSEEFLKKDLPALLKTVTQLYPSALKPDRPDLDPEPLDTKLSTASIAAKLSAKSGPELIISACANLALVQNKKTYSRRSILDEMKQATGVYTSSHGANLTRDLRKLLKGDLTKHSDNTFALKSEKLNELRAKLAK